MARLYTAISFGLVLTGLIFHVARGEVYYVASDVSDCRHVEAHESCYTLDHYANSTTLRVIDSVFYFMPGKHLLRRMWNITGAINLTLTSQFPRSDSSESDVVIECTDLSDDGILVSGGQNITMENFAMLRCKRRTVLSFTLTHSIKLSDLTINGSKGYVTRCLALLGSKGYILTDSVFSHCGKAISIYNSASGMLESMRFLDNYIVLVAVSWLKMELGNLEMNGIYSSGNTVGVYIESCSLRFSLTGSYFIDSGSVVIRTSELCGGEYSYGSTHPLLK